uniref:Protein kinase domain-containing protein n=1 Tax=Oryzias melastigma TaxID=30732 RepID=A0A3B3CWH0_ORYME
NLSSISDVHRVGQGASLPSMHLIKVNMAHCDIKLDNIMLVNQASEPFRVKLIDFGLTKNPGDMQTGTLMQNLRFRAPEVILGLPLDERVDTWTVGYVLALLYTGFHIHPVDSEYAVIRSLTMKQGMPDQELLDQGWFTDSEVDLFLKLLWQMLEIDPNKRITPEEALKHPFFTMEQPSADSERIQSKLLFQVEHLFCELILRCSIYSHFLLQFHALSYFIIAL